jgi:16S rRNA (guanine527-N7)-methyltransferase
VKQRTWPSPASSLEEDLLWFEGWLASLSIAWSPAAAAAMRTYLQTLMWWNRKTNLVSRGDEAHLVRRHVCESVVPLLLVDIGRSAELLDLGSGAGFPGLVLKLLRPDLRITLLESQRRRVLFLRHVAELLALDDIEVAGARAEELADKIGYAGRYHLVTARAVDSLDRLWRWSTSLLAPGGRLLAFKGGDLASEIDGLQRADRVSTAVMPFPDIEPFRGGDRKLLVVQEESQGEP